MSESQQERKSLGQRFADWKAPRRFDYSFYRFGDGILPLPSDHVLTRALVGLDVKPDATIVLEARRFSRRVSLVEARDAEGNELPVDVDTIVDNVMAYDPWRLKSTILLENGKPSVEITYLHGEWPSRFNTPEDPIC